MNAQSAAVTTEVATNRMPQRAAENLEDMLQIAGHPAFRLGVLDAARGAPFDPCDVLPARICDETPDRARGIWTPGWWVSSAEFELAQKRYEEGREAVIGWRLKVRSWSDPRFPPKAVRGWCEQFAKEMAR